MPVPRVVHFLLQNQVEVVEMVQASPASAALGLCRHDLKSIHTNTRTGERRTNVFMFLY